MATNKTITDLLERSEVAAKRAEKACVRAMIFSNISIVISLITIGFIVWTRYSS